MNRKVQLSVGLQGKAVCPVLMGFGCTIGGAAGTRVMDNWGQRMLAMAVLWAVPCGSIWSVVPVISNMFFKPWQTALVCIGILAWMTIMMIITAKVFGNKLSSEESRSGMIMELPPIHKARIKHIAKESWYKTWDMFKRAFRTISLFSLIFWAFSYSSTGAIEGSLIYKIGTAIEPVTRFFGLGWQTFIAFLASAFAKEAVLGVLTALFAGGASLSDITFNAAGAADNVAGIANMMPGIVGQAEALAFIFAMTFNIPCVMALGATYRESHSVKWTAMVAVFYAACALLLSCVIYHIAGVFL